MADSISVTTTYKTSLLIYILHKNDKNEFTDEAEEINTTLVETYEKTVATRSWTDANNVAQQDEVVLSDPSSILPLELRNEDPLIVDGDDDWQETLMSYLQFAYQDGGNNYEKYIRLNFNGAQEYLHYKIEEDLINTLIKFNYVYFTFYLNNKDIYLPEKQYTIKGLTLNQSVIHIKDSVIITTDFMTLKDCIFLGTINEAKESGYANFNVTVNKKIVMSNIEVKDDFVCFSIINGSTDASLWTKTICSITRLTINIPKVFKSAIDPMFRIGGFYHTDILAYDITLEESNGTIFGLKKMQEILIANFKFFANFKISRSILSMDEIANSTISDCTIQQKEKYNPNNQQTPLPFFAIFHNGDQLAEHKIVNSIFESIGIASFINDNSAKVTIMNNTLHNYKNPFKFSKSVINKLVFMDNTLVNVEDLSLTANTVSFFNGDINLSRLLIEVFEKCYLNGSVLKTDYSIEITLNENASFIADEATLRSKNFIIKSSEKDTGRVSCTKCRLEFTEDITITDLAKISLATGEIKCKTLTLGAVSISQLTSEIAMQALDKISLTATKLTSSTIAIVGNNEKTHDIEISNTKGDFEIIYSNKTPKKSGLTLKNSIINIDYKKLEPTEVSQIELICLEDCKGSKVLAQKNDQIEFIPSLDGTYQDMKMIKSIDDLEPGKSKDIILYGSV